VRQRGVLADRELEQQPELLAVLGQQAHARLHRAARIAGRTFCRRPRCARLDGSAPKIAAAARCGPSRAARDADDLAGAHLEVDRRRRALRLQAVDAQARLADRALARG
jgi:hypothetical protein